MNLNDIITPNDTELRATGQRTLDTFHTTGVVWQSVDTFGCSLARSEDAKILEWAAGSFAQWPPLTHETRQGMKGWDATAYDMQRADTLDFLKTLVLALEGEHLTRQERQAFAAAWDNDPVDMPTISGIRSSISGRQTPHDQIKAKDAEIRAAAKAQDKTTAQLGATARLGTKTD